MARKYVPKNKYPKLSVDQRTENVLMKSKNEIATLKVSDCEIARKFNCSPKTVKNTYEKWQKTKTVTSIKQRGRKRILNDTDRCNLKKACLALPHETARDLRDHPQLNLKKASIDTIKRELRRMKLPAYVSRQRDQLKPHHMAARLKFAEEKEDFDWSRVCFSDEKTLQSHCHGRQYVRRPRGQAWKPKYVVRIDRTRRFKVNLWGYISADSCGLVHIEGKHNGTSYLNILQSVKIENIACLAEKKVFMQDNAPIHKTTAVMEYLNKNVQVLPWPAYSPDLNPIEHVWVQMQRKVYQFLRLGVRLRNRNDLLNLAKRSFYEVCSKEYLKKLYLSMPKRIAQVIQEKGKRTRY